MLSKVYTKMMNYVKVKKFKEKIKDCFSIKSSIGDLINTSTKFFLIPMDLDGIINGVRNKTKFRMSIVDLIYVLFSITLNTFLFQLQIIYIFY